MSLIVLASAKGGPGVSTSALALALSWPRRALLVDADPAGGDLLAGFFRGEQAAGQGALALTLEARRSSMEAQLWSQVLPLADPATAWLLAGVSSPRQVRSVDWPQLAATLAALHYGSDPVDVLVDLGRLRPETEATRPDSPGPEPLLRAADLVVLVLEGTLPAVRAAQLRVEQLQAQLAGGPAGPGRVVALLVGGGRPYGQGEISAAVGVPVAAALPRDHSTADTLMAGAPAGRGWRHASLMRAAGSAADVLVQLAEAQHVAPPAAATAATPAPRPSGRLAAAAAAARTGWTPLPTVPDTAVGGGGHAG